MICVEKEKKVSIFEYAKKKRKEKMLPSLVTEIVC